MLRLAVIVSIALAGPAIRADVPESGGHRDPSGTVSLDGNHWLMATDPDNVGRDHEWWLQPANGAKPTRVPGVIEEIFPGYHGVVWYWSDFDAPPASYSQARYLLRFWCVDYLADVWVNGKSVGGHEGADGSFTLDATDAVKPGRVNRLAVRVLNPKDTPIDGIVLKETPHRNKTCVFTFGCDYNHGGIEDSVELIVTPAVYVQDLFVRSNWQTGDIRVRAAVQNTSTDVDASLEFSVAPAFDGDTLQNVVLPQHLAPGETEVETHLKVGNPRLWDLENPYLYRVSARVWTGTPESFHEKSVRTGFRDFRIEDGYFRLNGHRIFLRGSHTGNMVPIGIHVSPDTDWLRRDLVNVKAMGFNAIRFISGPATRFQLDLCDEIGLLVYEEPYSSWLLADSPHMAERFDHATADLIRRDRNHPSVVIWGLLNETGDGPVFRHAVDSLQLVRSLDDSRMVLLNSGRFDGQLGIGSVSNPGADACQYLLGEERPGGPTTQVGGAPPYFVGMGDAHTYPGVPHQASDILFLRTFGENGKGVFLSEYGVASAVDLVRMTRQFEQRGKASLPEAQFYGKALEQFMADWGRWNLAECFGRPEDYFTACLTAMSEWRLLGINAIRSNPHAIGYSLTGTVDQGYSGEGLTTPFRELKPGTVDAVFDGLAPLRWCLFSEPANLYRGETVTLEAVLANEDVLSAGQYPARFEVFGPDQSKVLEREVTVDIPEVGSAPERPFALPVFSAQVAADWPEGQYRFVATFERGAAAAGRESAFYVADPALMPPVETEIVLWGDDAELLKWLGNRGIRVRPFAGGPQNTREVILVSGTPPAPGGHPAFRDLAQRIAQGSAAVFLSPGVFAIEGSPTAGVPVANKGTLVDAWNSVYHKDEWAKHHPIFDGLPSGGLMDYRFYREIIPGIVWSDLEPPAEAVAGAIHSAPAYASGLLVSVHDLGAGRFILNTLRIRENLGNNPVAERLLRNMLRYAARDAHGPLVELPTDFDGQLTAMAL